MISSAQITGLYKELDQISSAIAWLITSGADAHDEKNRLKYNTNLVSYILTEVVFHAASDSCVLVQTYAMEKMKEFSNCWSRSKVCGNVSVCLKDRAGPDHVRPSLAESQRAGESALAYEEDFSIDDALKSLNATMTEESNDDHPSDTVHVDSLVEKAKAMEGERLDALVNSATHPLLTNESKVDQSIERSNVNTVSDDSASVESFDDSPPKEMADSLLTMDDVREEDQTNEVEEPEEEDDTGSEHTAEEMNVRPVLGILRMLVKVYRGNRTSSAVLRVAQL